MILARPTLGSLAVLLAPAFVTGPVMAQEGGRLVSFDLSQRFEANSNVDLDPGVEDESALLSTTRLGFGITSATPISTLGLQLGGLYREDFRDTESSGFEGPDASLSYDRRGANSGFSFGAGYSSQDVDYLDAFDLTDFVDETGELPPDFNDFEDAFERTGTRESLRVNTTLSYGTDGPYGVSVSLSGRDVSYSDLSEGSTLEDARDFNASVTGRIDLNPVISTSTTLRYRYAEEGDDVEETTGLGFGVDYRQAIVTYSTSFDVNRVDEGTRIGLSGGIARDFAGEGRLSLNLGLVQTANDDLTWNGSAAYSQPLDPVSNVNVTFRRAVSSDPEEGETANTVLSAGYTRSLSRLTSLGINAQFARTEDLDIDATDTTGRVSATLSRQLTRDWSLTGGLSHTFREEDDLGSASSESVFVQIGRSFVSPF
ncbi:hypothetical protein [Palleronia sp. LCG004]|uniref:hypothetical protein n=1 Tax=Palleronia sp. LCG004 TaxID=3079304 RepID=UPI002942F68C|nr:hypothetical protein [Palleronia sp. LCG004]WOI58416.1 hypothetical protein RVY76_18195 [Palleronia sp. LCG004]